MSFQINRVVRTQSSEQYVISDHSDRVGDLNLHFKNCVYGTLILLKKLSDEEFNELIAHIENDILSSIEPRDDFIFTVYIGEEMGFYSDITDLTKGPATREDFEKVSKSIDKVLVRQQIAAGQLNEFAVIEYFKSFGFVTEKASNELDHLKIDVIASNENETIFVQVKNGQISRTEISDVVKNTKKIPCGNAKRVGIVADQFPPDCELLRILLEKETNIPIIFIHKYQVLAIKPEFKRTLR